MQSSLFLVLRRMRAPLLAVIVVWTVSITGLVAIPGEDAAGHPVRMDFLHALYFISYTATTIGFGEIPYAFTPAQRLWVTFCIYLTVVAWSYAFVKLLALFQDRWFLQAIAEQRFKHQVRRLSEPFYLVCGYGESGRLLCRAFDGMGRRFVVLDADERRLAELEAADYRSDTPALAADARDPETLMLAGVKHRQCAAVLALTGEERANVAVAAAVRLLRPDLTLICRAESPASASEMRLFGVDRIINPHQQFADYLSIAIQSPGSYQLMAWLTGLPGTTLEPETEPPVGPWLVYGDGFFTEQVAAKLHQQGAEVWTLGIRPASAPPLAGSAERWQPADMAGDVGEALRHAGVERAAGLIAGSDDDSRNLSVTAAARTLCAGLYVVLRQNHRANQILFDRFDSDITVFSPEIIVHECLAHLNTPLLAPFLKIVAERDDAWSDAIVRKLRHKITRTVPSVWTVELTSGGAPAPAYRLRRGDGVVRMDHLVRDPADRDRHLRCVPLLIDRGGESLVMPGLDVLLQAGDRMLFAGTRDSCDAQWLLLQNVNVLNYVCEGRNVPEAWLWRKLTARQRPDRFDVGSPN